MKFTAIILNLFFITLLANSQELKKIIEKKENSSIFEEYFVFKEDKSIKHGKYLKYSERLAVEKYIQEFGSFDHNKKTGVWFLFNITHPQNPLSIVGEYSNGEKTGQWFYFYPPELKDTSVLFLLGYKKLTGVIEPKRKDQEFQITIDTTGTKLAATGNFENNKKVGKWSYYSKDGRLIKEYDFSSNKVIYLFQNDSISLYLLGGITHFQEQLSQLLLENTQKINSFQPSKAKFEIITYANTLFVNNLTTIINDPFAEFIENRIKNMSLDWVDYDPIFEKFSFIIEINFRNTKNGPFFNIGSLKPNFNKD
jgi:antitoxin component YwqK of YwqJK toxin-antitoxin module